MKIYFDACCLNRPFDDQTQERIRLETEAIRIIWALAKDGRYIWVTSEVVEDEILAASDSARRDSLLNVIRGASLYLSLTGTAIQQAKSFCGKGIPAQDALHLTVAMEGNSDVFLTVDDRLIAKAHKLHPPLGMKVENPLSWVVEGMKK
jgi:predicted nucleic acid-binding protein